MAIFESRKKSKSPRKQKRTPPNRFSFSSASTSPQSSSFSMPPPTPSLSRTFSRSTMQENIENAELLITKWNPNGASYTKLVFLFQDNRREAKEFVESVKGLRRAMHFLLSQDSGSEKLASAQKLMEIAMKRLENEFYHILSSNREFLEPESVSSSSSRLSRSSDSECELGGERSDDDIHEITSDVERKSITTITDLRLIADTMIGAGYGRECVKIYKIVRKSILEESLYRLGIEHFDVSRINKLNPEALEDALKRWLDAVKIAVKTIFHGEKFLCDHVLGASDAIRQSCFAHVVREGAANLFKFPELIAKSKRKPERIFRLMDVYESISELWPEIELIFSNESISDIKLQALSCLHKLGDSVRAILNKFVSSIQRDSSKTPITGGDIHPLTNSVMTYVSFLANYSAALNDIIADDFPPKKSEVPESYLHGMSEEIPTSAVSVKLTWIIIVLLCKLDTKADLYNDVALSYLFLANNLHCIVEKVRSSNLKYLLEEHWIAEHERKVKLYAGSFEYVAWSKVFSCLPENLSANMETETAKNCYRKFNLAFEEAYQKQAAWVVTDAKLRDAVQISITRKLVPVYKEFHEVNSGKLGREVMQELAKFSADNLESHLLALFRGMTSAGSSLLPSPSLSVSRAPRCIPLP